MCAINPKHKKRLILDVYTSFDIKKEDFDNMVLEMALQTEMALNTDGRLRWHLKESKEEAE